MVPIEIQPSLDSGQELTGQLVAGIGSCADIIAAQSFTEASVSVVRVLPVRLTDTLQAVHIRIHEKRVKIPPR